MFDPEFPVYLFKDFFSTKSAVLLQLSYLSGKRRVVDIILIT